MVPETTPPTVADETNVELVVRSAIRAIDMMRNQGGLAEWQMVDLFTTPDLDGERAHDATQRLQLGSLPAPAAAIRAEIMRIVGPAANTQRAANETEPARPTGIVLTDAMGVAR